MSRSYRKPFMAMTGVHSTKQDKRLAVRGVRRAQNHYIHTAPDFDNLLMPHRYECHWNDTWSWSCGGGKAYYSPHRYGHKIWYKKLLRK